MNDTTAYNNVIQTSMNTPAVLPNEIIFDDTATTLLDIADNYSSIMLEDKDKYFDIGTNILGCMECMNSDDSFPVALDYIAQWCGGSFGDDGGGSTCVLKRTFLAGVVHSGEADHKFGEGVGDLFHKCVASAVEKICIWDISALKWGKVLLQIFTDPRGSRFLACTCSYVCWYGYSCARRW